jgi:hypothetical protein
MYSNHWASKKHGKQKWKKWLHLSLCRCLNNKPWFTIVRHGKGKAIPVLNQVLRPAYIWWSGGIAPLFLTSAPDGGECSFHVRPPYLIHNSHRIHRIGPILYYRRLGGPQSWFGLWRSKRSLTLTRNKPRFLGSPDIPIELSRLIKNEELYGEILWWPNGDKEER